MKITATLILLAVLYSCSSGNDEKHSDSIDPVVQTVDYDNRTSIAKDYNDQLSQFISRNTEKYETSKFNNSESFNGSALNESDFIKRVRLRFKSRAPIKKNSLNYYTRFNLVSYEYYDTNSCNEAFESWLSQFGTMRIPIKKNENIEAFHNSPTYIVKNSKHLTAAFTDCKYMGKAWESFKMELTECLDSAEYIVDCGCGGPVIWK